MNRQNDSPQALEALAHAEPNEPQTRQIAVWAGLWFIGWVGLSALVGWLEP